MATMNREDIEEISQLVRDIELTVSGHRAKIVLLAIDKVKAKVMDMSYFKRENDKL